MKTTLEGLAEEIVQHGSRVLTGMESTLKMFVVALVAEGHVLVEGVPGVAKTLLARTLARLVGGEFARIQFTPDLMPSDVVGTSVFDLESRRFHLRKGPVFANVVLADEINRAPAKTQSALLESMQERQVSIDGQTHLLPRPFLVIATQNPVEHEGTYRLPEASLDRFFVRLAVDPPLEAAELDLLRVHLAGPRAAEARLEGIAPVVTKEHLREAAAEVAAVTVTEEVLRYLLLIVRTTRSEASLLLGASPRAGIALLTAARAFAGIQGRDYLTPDDIQVMVKPVLGHRLVLDPVAELDGRTTHDVLQEILLRVPVPR